MMRGFFKAVKLAYFNIIPRDGYKGIHCFDYRDLRAMEVWRKFCNVVKENKSSGKVEELLENRIKCFNAENFY
jgi:hypothetical protein